MKNCWFLNGQVITRYLRTGWVSTCLEISTREINTWGSVFEAFGLKAGFLGGGSFWPLRLG